MNYKITPKNQLHAVEALLYLTIILAIIVFYFYKIEGDAGRGIVYVFGTGYLIVFIPTVFLHIEYYIINKNDLLTIDSKNEVIVLNDSLLAHYVEIESITFYMSPVWFRKDNFKLLAFEDYRYVTIKFSNGKTYIFTCLMGRDLEKVVALLGVVPTEKKTRVIASPLVERMFF